MITLGKYSLQNLITCQPELVELITEVSKEQNIQVTCGFRNKEDQEKAYKDGFSKAHWLQSPHNYNPSYAVDVVPYPAKWSDENKLRELGKIILEKAKKLNIDIEWGGNWKFVDLPHYEIRDWKNKI
jgi:peptidoglycan LD-endopeptidase CwlK